MKGLWKNGELPAGETCNYSSNCEFKFFACNGMGCLVSDGKITDIDFSCGAARLFRMIEEEDE